MDGGVFAMNVPDTEELQAIYHAIADEASRQIYRHRLLYSLLGEKSEIASMVNDVLPADISLKTAKICYYGAGEGGRWFIRNDHHVNYNFPFFIDKYKTGILGNVPIISLDDFLKLPDHKEYLVIITVSKSDILTEIAAELESYGLHYMLGFSGLPYFDLPELDLRNEYFADLGALDGDTTRYFLEHFENGHAYVFEPNPKQFEITREHLKMYSQAEVFPYGISDQNAVLRFEPREERPSSSRLSKNGSIEIEARKLDDLLGDRKVTFIKMDIEGAELAALRGAKRIIREQRPKLAICVYHKPEDIWEIPGLILSYHPDYRLYLRHYSLGYSETVLYAV